MHPIRTLLVLVLFTSSAFGQYYEPKHYTASDARFVYVGAMQRDFFPGGGNGFPDSLQIRFNRVFGQIGFRQGLVDGNLAIGRYTIRGESHTAVAVNFTVANDILILRGATEAVLIPIQVIADFNRAESAGSERNAFDISSLGLGAGLKYRYFSRDVEFTLQIHENALLSFEGFSGGTGHSFSTTGEVSFLFPDALVMNGIACGYRLRFQTWKMHESGFNYKANDHGIFIGVLF